MILDEELRCFVVVVGLVGEAEKYPRLLPACRRADCSMLERSTLPEVCEPTALSWGLSLDLGGYRHLDSEQLSDTNRST